jgi:anti-sigma-K factor RskA
MTGDEALGIPEHRDTVERLEHGVARVTPPDDLFDRIVEDVRPSAEVVPFRRRRFTAWASTAAAAAAAAAAAVVLTLAVTGEDDGLGSPIKTVRISNERVDGTLALYSPEGGNRVLVADLDRVPRTPEDEYYQLWVSRPGSDVKIPIGAFNPSDGKAHLEVLLPTDDKQLTIDISIEEETGPPDHSGRTIAAARLT